MSIADVALICGTRVEIVRQHLALPGWREGEQWVSDADGVAVREASLPELVGEFCVTGEREAAQRLMHWLTRATETSYPPRRRRGYWWLKENEEEAVA